MPGRGEKGVSRYLGNPALNTSTFAQYNNFVYCPTSLRRPCAFRSSRKHITASKMSNSLYPATPLQQHGYTPYSTPGDPYPLAALSTGQTPAEHSIYSEHDPSSTAAHGADRVSGTPGASDAKTRLRKACDSCSTRKVKVSAYYPNASPSDDPACPAGG